MKHIVIFIFIFYGYASASTLDCTVYHNGEMVSKRRVELPSQSRADLDEVASFNIQIKNLGKNQFELEVFDANGPSRTYSRGSLTSKEDLLSWTYWSRDALIESSCQKVFNSILHD